MLTEAYPTLDSLLGRCTLPIAALLKEREKAQMAESISVVSYSPGDTIAKQSTRTSHVPYLVSGLVKVYRELRRGKNLILAIEGAGSFVGLSSVLGGGVYEFTVSAIEPCTVAHFDIGAFTSVLRRNGLLSLEVAKRVSQDTTASINRLSGLVHKQLPGRVADLILYFSETIYRSPAFRLPLTRQELAELCGTTKESLIRTLSEFNHDRIIELERQGIKIVSADILKTLSRLG